MRKVRGEVTIITREFEAGIKLRTVTVIGR